MRFLSKRHVYTSSANIQANSRLKATAIFQTALLIVPPVIYPHWADRFLSVSTNSNNSIILFIETCQERANPNGAGRCGVSPQRGQRATKCARGGDFPLYIKIFDPYRKKDNRYRSVMRGNRFADRRYCISPYGGKIFHTHFTAFAVY